MSAGAVVLLVLVVVVLLILVGAFVTQIPEIRRYLKAKSM